MKKRIVVCADGTWNRPEKNLREDVPTNVIRLARAVSPCRGASTAPGHGFRGGLVRGNPLGGFFFCVRSRDGPAVFW